MQKEIYSETSREETVGQISSLTAKLLRKKQCNKETYCENVRRNSNDSVLVPADGNQDQCEEFLVQRSGWFSRRL
jgi:hypothetical protein